MAPLNPQLYDALRRQFGEVAIQNQGQPARITTLPNWSRNGRPQTQITGGEYYCVSCPFCTDTRRRLNFNYLWATDNNDNIAQEHLHLVHCFNEDCVKNRATQLELFDTVYPLGHRLQGLTRPIRTEADLCDQIPAEHFRITLPKGLVSVNHRTQAVPASEYLRSRGYDPGELWKRWRVCYCEQNSNCEPAISRPRIVVPVYAFPAIALDDGELPDGPILAGWQARVIESVPRHVPKYLTAKGMRKSGLLYGLTAAVDDTGPVVICEGVTDVWRLRSNAVALFGKSLSLHQQRLLVEHFAGRPLVVFLDEDAQEQAVDARNRLLQARQAAGDSAAVVIARCPDGRSDIGDCTFGEAWDQVAAALHCSRDDLDIDFDNLPVPAHPQEVLRRFRPVPRSPVA